MKLPLLLITLSACASGASPPMDVSAENPAEHDLVSFVRADAQRLQLADLRLTHESDADLEVRLWSGFGLTGVDLLRIERTGTRWAATQYRLRRSAVDAGTPVADSIDWRSRWQAAERAGISSLAPVPARKMSQPVEDGLSIVVEVRAGQRYWNAAADNPDFFCSTDDQRLLAVANALLGRSLSCRE